MAEREDRELQREAFKARQNRDKKLDAKLDAFSVLAETLSRGLLIAAGYRQRHGRGVSIIFVHRPSRMPRTPVTRITSWMLGLVTRKASAGNTTTR